MIRRITETAHNPPHGVDNAIGHGAVDPVAALTFDVAPGDRVSAGQRLLTLEAMKMETALDSPVDGDVLEVLVSSGDQVVPGAGLVLLRQNGSRP